MTAVRPAFDALVGLALGIALAACARGAPAAGDPPDDAAALPAVRVGTAAVTAATVPVTVTASGTVAARRGALATLGAPSATRVTRVYVAVGDPVRAGQPLVAFDVAPFAAAARQADVGGQTARQAYDRAARLAAEGVVPRRDVEVARAALATADAAAVTARRALAFATLRSPINGVVVRQAAVLDAPADPGTPLVEVVDPTALEVRAQLTPADAGRVRAGAPAVVTSDAPSDTLGTGAVVALAPAVDSASGSVEARVALGRARRTLRLGEAVRVTVEAGAHRGALVVPAAALVPNGSGDGYQVYVVVAGDTARARPVRVGVRTAALAEVTAGLRAGETVITEGAYGVEDGVRVAPRRAP